MGRKKMLVIQVKTLFTKLLELTHYNFGPYNAFGLVLNEVETVKDSNFAKKDKGKKTFDTLHNDQVTKSHVEYYNGGVFVKVGCLEPLKEKVDENVIPKSFMNAIKGEGATKKVNFKELKQTSQLEDGIDVELSLDAVMKANEMYSTMLYGYFIGVMDVIEKGSWIIKLILIILNKWCLTKEDLTKVPVWVKLRDVPLVGFNQDGLSDIDTKVGKPIMLDSYTSTMCMESWGRPSYARAMVEILAVNELKESITVANPSLVRGEKCWILLRWHMNGDLLVVLIVKYLVMWIQIPQNKLFGSASSVESISDPHSLFRNKIPPDKANYMVRQVTDVEVKEVMFSIDENKSLGSDGYTSAFFKHAWEIVGKDVTEAV
nr:hypothetical protein [Tanacetum cinerariifolium]